MIKQDIKRLKLIKLGNLHTGDYMKKLKPILLIFFLLIIYIYTCNIAFLPNNIIIFQGEELNIKTIYGLKIRQKDENALNYEAMQTSTKIGKKVGDNIGNINLTLDLFGTIPLKEIDVNVLQRTKVIPLGNSVGLKLYTKGVLVVGMSEIKGQDNVKYKPYENSGIEEGDLITAVNNVQVLCTDDLVQNVNKCNGSEIQISYIRNEDTLTTYIKPAKISENDYKLGLWVRDAAAGVGTATFYEPSTGMFTALGHGITDIDTGDIVKISNGELTTSSIISIKKGERGKPGEVRGTIESGSKIGDVYKNGNFGISGLVTNKENLKLNNMEEMEVALRSEIKEGEAYIICELENGKVEKYNVEIEKIYTSNNYDNKSMMIKITDKRLLDKTRAVLFKV